MIFKDLFINFSTSCVWLRFQTEEALFTTLKIAYTLHITDFSIQMAIVLRSVWGSTWDRALY